MAPHGLPLRRRVPMPQVNLRLALSVQFHTRWHYIAIYGSIALWLAFVCGYNALPLGLLGSIAHQVCRSDVVSQMLVRCFADLCSVIPVPSSLLEW